VAIRPFFADFPRENGLPHQCAALVRNDMVIGKSLRLEGVPVPSSVAFGATFPPGKVFGGYVFALVFLILQHRAAGRLIIAPTDFGFWKSVCYQILDLVGGDAHIAP
jgi:hypothetical protein